MPRGASLGCFIGAVSRYVDSQRGDSFVCSRPMLSVLAVATALVLGCNPNIQRNPNENSGGDGERGRAALMAIGAPLNDNVDYNAGDTTDWKYFQIPSAGSISVRLGCDYAGAGCVANVRDAVGVVLCRLEGRQEPVSEAIGVTRGNYYLEVYAQAAATDYTVLVEFEPN